MYDLPSEQVGESGLPDEFHRLQGELLTETCRSPLYDRDRCFIACDLNLYYDSRNTSLYKRPDWFLALDVPQANQQADLRWSYLVWQESVPPFLVLEFLSPGTEAEDLGTALRSLNQPPRKWEVYERLLRVPYYGVYDRYQNQFRLFCLQGSLYQELDLPRSQFWLEDLGLGLGLWDGDYQGIGGRWLRWYGVDNQWIPTTAEQVTQERREKEEAQRRAEQAESQYQALLQRLQAQGLDPQDFVS